MKFTRKSIAMTAAVSLTFAALTAVSADDAIKVTLNGSEISFDVAPRIIDERTMVPLRAIFEAMGATVDWDGETQTVTAVNDDTTVKMTIGSYDISVNEEIKTFDVAPVIIDERTLVPARAVAESFGAIVDWDGETQTVIITTNEPAEDITPDPTPTESPTAEPTEAPTAEPTEAPTAEPTETPIAEQGETSAIPIEYDMDSTTSDTVKSFKIDSWAVEPNGDYNIKFSFRTFLEGPGSVAANFNCLDESGNVIATIGGMYKTVDYQFTPQSDTAVIPAATKRIVLANN